jgi:hypothetical protein
MFLVYSNNSDLNDGSWSMEIEGKNFIPHFHGDNKPRQVLEFIEARRILIS